jgi:benzoyl-CoA reductase subunit B
MGSILVLQVWGHGAERRVRSNNLLLRPRSSNGSLSLETAFVLMFEMGRLRSHPARYLLRCTKVKHLKLTSSDTMHYIKRASELRLEAMSLCRTKPAPATFLDWIASIAPINFLPGNQALVDYFTGVKVEIEQRIKDGTVALPNKRYRLAFEGIMNWNKVGWLANKFAEVDAAVLVGRYTHNSLWNEPQLMDEDDPILGMAQHYLLCPFNHSAKVLGELLLRECEIHGIDGVVFHATRTCRSASNGQLIMAQMAQRAGMQTILFEGDVADASFYKDTILESRLEAMLEAIDSRRMASA